MVSVRSVYALARAGDRKANAALKRRISVLVALMLFKCSRHNVVPQAGAQLKAASTNVRPVVGARLAFNAARSCRILDSRPVNRS